MQPKVKQELESRVLDTGDTMTGNLDIKTPIDMIPNLRLIPSEGINGSTSLYKNTSSTKDYGTHLVDSEINGDSVRLSLIASKINDFSKSIYFNVKKADGTTIDYPIYHTGYKPTAKELNVLSKYGDTVLGELVFTTVENNGLEGGQITLLAPKGDSTKGGTVIDNYRGEFRIFGRASEDGTTLTGYGSIFAINPYGPYISAPAYTMSLTNLKTKFLSQEIDDGLIHFDQKHSNGYLTRIQLTSNNGSGFVNYQDNNNYRIIEISPNYDLFSQNPFYTVRKDGINHTYTILHTGNYYNYTPKSFYRVLDDFDKLSELGYNACNFTSAATAGHFIIGREWGWNTDGNNFGMQLRIDGWTGKLYTRSFDGWGPAWSAWKYHWQEGDAVTSAVWNDYAEYREADIIEPGYVLVEKGDDTLTKSSKRLSHFYGVSSDTWGFSQGETEKAKTPIAVAGRVLVYPFQKRENYEPGQCVCAGPGGTVDIMTDEEVMKYPDKIVGVVSCVPNYDTWGGGENADRKPVKVNGRIWIKVK